MAEVVRGMSFRLVVETNKDTYKYVGASWRQLRLILKNAEREGLAPALCRSVRPVASDPTSALQRLAGLRTEAWNAFDVMWRELRSNFGDFEDDYREWKSSGEDDEIDACELAAYTLYAALKADTVAAASEEELLSLDQHAPPMFGNVVALEWFRESRKSREAPRD